MIQSARITDQDVFLTLVIQTSQKALRTPRHDSGR
jgi:hypothetical protein